MKVEENILRDVGRLVLYYIFPVLVKILPAGTEFALYRFLGRIFYRISRGKRAIVEKNLSLAFPDRGPDFIQEQTRQYFENHFVDRLQLFSFSRLTEKTIDRYIIFEGMDHLRQALMAGKGSVLVHGHYGPAQLFIAGIALSGFPITQIGYVSREGYSFIGKHVAVKKRLELEAAIPGSIFYADKFMKPIFKKLRYNEVIANAGDGTGGGLELGKSIRLPFLHSERNFPTGSVALAQRTGAALIPLLLSKKSDGRYLGSFQQHIAAGTSKEEMAKAVSDFAGLLENHLTKQPGLWHFWDEFPTR